MADIVFRYPEMRNCASTIRNDIISGYTSAANTFQNNFASATSAWEGDSKDKMQAFITGPVNDYMVKTIPEMLEALAALLEFNADSMEKADAEIASNIPTSL